MGETLTEKIADVAERVAASEGLEVVEVELLGGGGSRLLRVTIDKPEGVSHQDCELMSKHLGMILDVEETIPGGRYTLEISSPGVERKLFRPKDFERFSGQKIKVVLKQAREGRKTFEGVFHLRSPQVIDLECAPGNTLDIRLEEIARANLKFEWR